MSGDTRQPQGQIPLLGRPFVYLRHGETTSNRDAMIAGALDVELTTLGREQARQAGERLARLARREGVAFAPIVSSRLQRAMETARIVAQAVDCTPESILHLPDLDERCWGALEGRPRSERRDDALPPDIETADAFFSRVARGMAAIPMPEKLAAGGGSALRRVARAVPAGRHPGRTSTDRQCGADAHLANGDGRLGCRTPVSVARRSYRPGPHARITRRA